MLTHKTHHFEVQETVHQAGAARASRNEDDRKMKKTIQMEKGHESHHERTQSAPTEPTGELMCCVQVGGSQGS